MLCNCWSYNLQSPDGEALDSLIYDKDCQNVFAYPSDNILLQWLLSPNWEDPSTRKCKLSGNIYFQKKLSSVFSCYSIPTNCNTWNIDFQFQCPQYLPNQLNYTFFFHPLQCYRQNNVHQWLISSMLLILWSMIYFHTGNSLVKRIFPWLLDNLTINQISQKILLAVNSTDWSNDEEARGLSGL